MTIEEAIKVLQNVVACADADGCTLSCESCEFYVTNEQVLTAHEMAISALRQQDVTDKDVGKKMTNADRIRSMSEEELALWICSVYDIEEEHGKFINGIIIPGYAPHDIEEWLQMPAEEDDHEND